MKKNVMLIVAVLAASLAFGQMKYRPSEVNVIVLGPKNPTFDEAKFPDLHFYYLPDLKLKVSKKAAANNSSKHAWSSALGVGRTAGAESHDDYSGQPEAIVNNSRLRSGSSFIFDKNGIVNGKSFMGKTLDFNNKSDFLVKFNKMKRSWESETLGTLMKNLVKKSETYPVPKKKKKSKTIPQKFSLGQGAASFELMKSGGEKTDIQSLVIRNPATLLLFLYISPEYDFNKGKESGAGKTGKNYMNQVAQAVAADKQIAPLYNLEKGIFGKRIEQ